MDYEVEITRLLLGFRALQGDPDLEEVSSISPAAMVQIRRNATHKFHLSSPHSTTGTVEAVKIFEAGGMIVSDTKPERHRMKQSASNDRRCSENDETTSIGSVFEDRYWICCNPRNYESHGKVGVPMTFGICGECPHGRCSQCVVSGGLKRGSFGGLAAHTVNPVEKYAVTIKERDG